MIHITGKTYEVITDHKNGWNPEAFKDRYSDVLDRYDYIIGDWGYNQLRLKGFFRDNHSKVTKDTTISSMVDYINEYCNFGCAYFVVEKVKEQKPEKSDKPDKPEKTDKPEKSEKLDKSDKPEKVQQDGGGQPTQKQQAKKSQHQQQQQKADQKSDHKADRADKADKADRSQQQQPVSAAQPQVQASSGTSE